MESKILPGTVVALLLMAASVAGVAPPGEPLGGGSCAGWGKRHKKHTQSAAEQHYEEGRSRLKNEDLDGAIDAFLQATYYARNGYYPKAYYWLAVCYMDKRMDGKAIGAFEKARKQYVDPNWDINIALAEIHLRNGRYDDCDRELNDISESDEKMRQRIQFVLGLMEDRRGNFGASERHFRMALGDKPWSWTKAWLYYGEAKMKQKNWREALREFRDLLHAEKFLKKEPDDRIFHDIGVCRLAIGDHQGAIDAWHTSLSYNKENPEVWLQLAMLFESEGHLSSAATNYRQFLKYAPSGDKRTQHVRDRLTAINLKLSPNDTVPTRAKPSIYMRKQMEGLKEKQQSFQRQQQHRVQEQQRVEQDSGF